MKTRVAVVGERDEGIVAHRGIEAAMRLWGQGVEWAWLGTATVGRPEERLAGFSAVWCAPGSPYADTEGALAAIRWARENGRVFLGTCGGYQHALMEFARDVVGRTAAHAEMEPEAAEPLIARLSCSLSGATGRVTVAAGSGFETVLGARETMEEFNCNFGLAPGLEAVFAGTALEFVARDENGEPRALRLRGHPFFVGTLFQPERRALRGELHPVVRAFLEAAGR